MTTILDYGTCNVGSLINAFKKIGKDVCVTDSPEILQQAERIILPGIGSFDQAIRVLRNKGLIDVLNQLVLEDKVPILGICLGMHLFAESSEEGQERGFGWVAGNVMRFNSDSEFKVPHIGWRTVRICNSGLLDREISDRDFYFLHSYYLNCVERSEIHSIATYGEDFVASIQKKNIFGVQFHPEKSFEAGLNFLNRFTSFNKSNYVENYTYATSAK